MLLILYICLEIFLFPFIVIYIFLNKKNRVSFFKRLGFGLPRSSKSLLVHTVSVGEFLGGKKLIEYLKENYKEEIFVSTVTLTGRELVIKENFKHLFFPFDFPICVEKFLNSLNPKVILIFETEIWPYFLYKCSKKNIPVIILNGRISDKSFKRYKYLKFFFKNFLDKINMILAQSKEDFEKFKFLGAKNVKIVGNLKFDFSIKEIDGEVKKIYDFFTEGRIGWVAGSTVKGEEEPILNFHREFLKENPKGFLILAPRHPERSKEVEELILKEGFKYFKRSDFPLKEKGEILLIDKIGELAFLYSYGNFAFVGGSLVEKGGHNILEPAYFKKPIIIGNSYFNFKEIVDFFKKNGGILILKKEEFNYNNLKKYDLKSIGERAYEVLMENRGVFERTLSFLKKYL